MRRRCGGLPVNTRESTGRMSRGAMWERGPAVLQTKGPPEAARVLAFVYDATTRRRETWRSPDMALSCKRPAQWVPDAIPTMDVLLHHLDAVVKKWMSRIKIGPGDRFSRSASDRRSRVGRNSEVPDPGSTPPPPVADRSCDAPPRISRSLSSGLPNARPEGSIRLRHDDTAFAHRGASANVPPPARTYL
jgi:hypothetical protein